MEGELLGRFEVASRKMEQMEAGSVETDQVGFQEYQELQQPDQQAHRLLAPATEVASRKMEQMEAGSVKTEQVGFQEYQELQQPDQQAHRLLAPATEMAPAPYWLLDRIQIVW
jgi:hypothetical protein